MENKAVVHIPTNITSRQSRIDTEINEKKKDVTSGKWDQGMHLANLLPTTDNCGVVPSHPSLGICTRMQKKQKAEPIREPHSRTITLSQLRSKHLTRR